MQPLSNASLCPDPGARDGDPVVAASEMLVLPICVCGILGNIFNLVVLTDRAMRRSLGPHESSANCGLVALAISDLLFCLAAFPFAFAPNLSDSRAGPAHLYGRANAAVISTFIMASTLLTVILATERYAAVCHPLTARRRLSLRRTQTLVAGAFAFSAVFNLPLLWGTKSVACLQPAGNSTGRYTQLFYVERVTIVDHRVDTAYRALWAVIGNFVPLALLLYCNARLFVSVKRALGQRRQMTSRLTSAAALSLGQENPNDKSTTLTITLVCIVVMFLVLVAPSETLKLYSLLSCSQQPHNTSHAAPLSLESNLSYRRIEAVTNCMQSLSFCLNFLLYCFALRSFRRALLRIVCRRLQGRQLGGVELVRLAVHGPPARRARRQPIRGEQLDSLAD